MCKNFMLGVMNNALNVHNYLPGSIFQASKFLQNAAVLARDGIIVYIHSLTIEVLDYCIHF